MSHTPGPWTVGDKRGVWVGPVISAEDGRKGVAFVCGESDGNARMIAAAPELLSALRLAVSLLTRASDNGSLYGRYDVDWMAMRESVQDVLNRAEGKVD
jgi:hypothetical protein